VQVHSLPRASACRTRASPDEAGARRIGERRWLVRGRSGPERPCQTVCPGPEPRSARGRGGPEDRRYQHKTLAACFLEKEAPHI